MSAGPISRPVIVLLVDDEPQIVHLLLLLLQSDSRYRVLTAQSGEQALAVSREFDGNLDILVTDLDLGAMSGIDLYRQIQVERPNTAVLFISGKADGFRKVLPDAPLLDKPFTPAMFLNTLAEVLATQPQHA